MEEKKLSKITELTDADLETHKLDESWQDIETHFLDKGLSSSIGYVAAFWSAIEHLLIIIIMTIHQLNEATGPILTVETSFLQRIAIITSSISLSCDEELFEEWCAIEIQLNALRITRNNIVHGMWLPSDSGFNLNRLTARGKLKIDQSNLNERDIRKTVVHILRLLKKVTGLQQKLEQVDLVTKMKASPRSLDRTQSLQARALDQARALKKSKRLAPQWPKLSSAQKRALREADNQKKDGDKP